MRARLTQLVCQVRGGVTRLPGCAARREYSERAAPDAVDVDSALQTAIIGSFARWVRTRCWAERDTCSIKKETQV